MEGGLRESWADSEESLVQKLPGLQWELGRVPTSALVYGVGLTRLKSCSAVGITSTSENHSVLFVGNIGSIGDSHTTKKYTYILL